MSENPERGEGEPAQLSKIARYPYRKLRALSRLPATLRSHAGALHELRTGLEHADAQAQHAQAKAEAAAARAQETSAAAEARLQELEKTMQKALSFQMQMEDLLRPSRPDVRYSRAALGPEPVWLDADLASHQSKTFSQNAEDGIIAYLFSRLGGTPGYFVEFGVGPRDGGDIEVEGLECNARLLQDQGWQGLYMDGRAYPERFGVKQERISALNINQLLDKYGVPLEFDMLSIDLDGQDFWVWMAVQRFPRVVIIEYNPAFHEDESFVMPMDTRYMWDGTQWYGASLLALHKLGEAKGYVLVFANGVNAFFVRKDLISNPEDFPFEKVFGYRGRIVYHRADPLNRAYQRV